MTKLPPPPLASNLRSLVPFFAERSGLPDNFDRTFYALDWIGYEGRRKNVDEPGLSRCASTCVHVRVEKEGIRMGERVTILINYKRSYPVCVRNMEWKFSFLFFFFFSIKRNIDPWKIERRIERNVERLEGNFSKSVVPSFLSFFCATISKTPRTLGSQDGRRRSRVDFCSSRPLSLFPVFWRHTQRIR